MRKTLAALLIALAAAAPSLSHALSRIDLFPIVDGSPQSTCNFNEPAPAGLREVAVVLNTAPGGDFVGVRFGVKESDINWQRLAITTPYTPVGSFDDFSVGFGQCLTQFPAVIATLQYFTTAHSPCGSITVVAAQNFAAPFGEDCSSQDFSLQSGSMTINGVYDVPPGAEDPSCYCPPAPTQQSTWGKVKALYRN